MILITGGSQDPNLTALFQSAKNSHHPVMLLVAGPDSHPVFTWDMMADRLLIDGEPFQPTAIFMRHDVFNEMADSRSEVAHRSYGWTTTLLGWIMRHPNVRFFNRACALQATNKTLVLGMAQELGLMIPNTIVSNDLNLIESVIESAPLVAKPVTGGGFCQNMNDALAFADRKDGRAAVPALIQSRLVPPEIRIYRVRDRFFAFSIKSDALDYRTTDHCRVESVPLESLPMTLVPALGRLMDRMGVDFGAADFKTCPETHRLLFLEVNVSPMFVAFDRVLDGMLSMAILDALCDG